jgi:hypothetical protein
MIEIDGLQVSPPGVLPTELVAELKGHKREILRVLKENEELAREVFGVNEKERVS